MTDNETLYHVTVLSNFARAFDKYAHVYSKSNIPESTFPNQFFLLQQEALAIGVEKASRLLEKLRINGDRLLVLETAVASSRIKKNQRTGLGLYVDSDHIVVAGVHFLDDRFALCPMEVEEAMAHSLAINEARFYPYPAIQPRTLSILPIAQACQAKCAFCFSKASISSDQRHAPPNWQQVSCWLRLAKSRGAERAVITGGGEPTLLPEGDLLRFISLSSTHFEKVVLITNAHILAQVSDEERRGRLSRLNDAGLSVLAVSRHHSDVDVNGRLMGLVTDLEPIAQTWRAGRERWPDLSMRLICVLQEGGVDSEDAIAAYLDWSCLLGIDEICFKELYVSSSSESVYFDRGANQWCRNHQVPLRLLTSFLSKQGFSVKQHLPWGAPVFEGRWLNRILRIAAYTEPSLFWERTHGIARSWNLMADGRAYVSLEDRASEISTEQVE